MKKVFYAIIGLLVVYLILCLAGPKVSHIERTTSINQKPEVVKTQLLDFKFFNEKWSPWMKKDPNMKITYSGEVGKPGCKYDWDGNPDSVGAGSMEFVGIFGDTIKQKLIFKSWNMVSDVHLITVAEGEGAKVTWALNMPMGFMWRGMGLFMSPEKMMGKDFDDGIASMKKAIESLAPATASMDYIEEDTNGESYFIGNKKEMMGFKDAGPMFAKNLPAIFAELKKMKIESSSAPAGLFGPNFDLPNEKAEMCAVVGVGKNVKVKGFETYVIPGGKRLMVQYFGAYEKMQPAYQFLDKIAKEKGYTRDIVVEEYVIDPGVEKDTAKWQTKIYYYVKK